MQLKLPVSSLRLTSLLFPTGQCSELRGYDSSHIEIQQILAKFPISVDAKNYTMLSEVFTADGIFEADLPTGPLQGLTTIEDWLLGALNNTLSQHSLGTQYIDIHDSHSADAITYFIATVVGVVDKAGSSLYNHAKYLDALILNEDREWRVENKTLVYMVYEIFPPSLQTCTSANRFAKIPSMGNTSLL